MVFNDDLMPIEEAIKKITLYPAIKFNLTGRGFIKEGNFADLTIFTARRSEVEIKSVVVNGTTVIKDGVFTKHTGGRVLRHAKNGESK